MTMTDPHILILALAGILIVAAAVRFYRHQCLLRDRAYLMREAVRNRDFSFRLPVKGLFFGERAMQQALNDMSLDIKALEARKEVESWQRLTRVLTHEIMNAATPICSISQAYLADPSIKGTPYEEGIIAIHQTGMGMTAFVENYRKL
ncbi:MAG: sensor histidine kinase, partial [Bacteroidaceae bacterium]|nr:sensor histidine kinase [Bacteroidaceae bacterium]